MSGFQLGGVRFRPVDSERTPFRSHTDDFVLVKDESRLRFYEALRPHLPKDILEIGVFEGGSLVWFDKLFKPSRLVGVERRAQPIDALETYRKTRPHIDVYYGRYQDKPGVLQAARQSFPKGLDLIVDDASHLYQETKATFEMLFPLLREGGHYVIECWRGPKWLRNGDGAEPKPDPAGRFVYELIAQLGLTPAIASVQLHSEAACVRRGRGPYAPGDVEVPRWASAAAEERPAKPPAV